jgi:hypothetical protein
MVIDRRQGALKPQTRKLVEVCGCANVPSSPHQQGGWEGLGSFTLLDEIAEGLSLMSVRRIRRTGTWWLFTVCTIFDALSASCGPPRRRCARALARTPASRIKPLATPSGTGGESCGKTEVWHWVLSCLDLHLSDRDDLTPVIFRQRMREFGN